MYSSEFSVNLLKTSFWTVIVLINLYQKQFWRTSFIISIIYIYIYAQLMLHVFTSMIKLPVTSFDN